MLHSNLSIIARGSDIFMSRCLDDFGITATEVTVLMYLYEHENPRQEDISDFFMLDKGTIAKTLRKLEGKGLITRQSNPQDLREKVITVTDKGYAVRDVCQNLFKLWQETMFAGLSETETKQFERMLGKIAHNVAAMLDAWETLYGTLTQQPTSG